MHLPDNLVCRISVACCTVNSENETEVYEQPPVDHLRWDHADLVSYDFITGKRPQLVLDRMHEFEQLEERNRGTSFNCGGIRNLIC
jgi:hypothetical protein